MSIVKLASVVLFITCTAVTALNVIPAGAQSPCGWTEYGSNPVFGQGFDSSLRAYYPKVLYDPNQFSEGDGDNHYYKMWFNSDNGTSGGYSIGYAYSDNGTSWTQVINPVNGLHQRSGHPLVKYDPDGFGHSGYYYKIWYWDEGAAGYGIFNLRYAKSKDGVTWEDDQVLTQDDTAKLVTSTSPDWNEGSYGPCDLIYNPYGSSDNISLWNNKYVMYYMGTDGTKEAIGLAYSDNGTHWKRYIYGNSNDPILSPGTADWDNTGVGYCSVINLSVNNWQMWYGGGPNTNYGIGYATSTDGINWTKPSNNPIFHISDNISWRNERTYTPWVVYDAANFGEPGNAYPYKMWFSGKSTTGKYSVGYAYALAVRADAGPDQTIISGSSTVIGGSPTASGGMPPYSYSWNPTTGLNDSTIANPIASPDTTTTYGVTITDSRGCNGSDNMTLSVQPPPPIGGGGGGLPASFYACPATLSADIQGNIATVKMTKGGVLCKDCLAKDAANKDTLELDKDTKVMLADNVVPVILRFRESSATPPAPENSAIVGPAYELKAYSSTVATTPSPITISPPAKLLLSYNPDELPKNTSEVFIATYDTEKGWLPLEPVPGEVAEIGKVHGLVNHFTIFAVLAKLAPPEVTKFEVSNLTVNPSQAQPNQKINISINVTNTGGESGDYNLDLKVDGTIKSSKQVIVAAGTSQTVNFTTTGFAAGKHQVEVAGLSGEFDVIKVPQPTNTNWWFIGGVTAIILLIMVVLIAWRR